MKRSYHIPGSGGARGYTPFGIETAKGATQHDLKEFWHVGRELPDGHRFVEFMAPNLWPGELGEFRATFLELFAAFDTAGGRILAAIARHLGLAPDFFDNTVDDGNSVLRLLHYPPVSADAPGVRAGAHEDINTITLLLGAEEAGLQLLDRDGSWLPVAPREGELVVNIGDMLQRLTNNVLKSTSHRVVNPAPERRGKSRYSMPFFLHFRPDYLIETLPSCISEERAEPLPGPDHRPRFPPGAAARDQAGLSPSIVTPDLIRGPSFRKEDGCRIRSGMTTSVSVLQVLRPEPEWQQLRDPPHHQLATVAARRDDLDIAPGDLCRLQDRLPAAAARRHRMRPGQRPVGADMPAGNRDARYPLQPERLVGGGQRRQFGADAEPVAGIFHIGADRHLAVDRFDRAADAEAGIRRISRQRRRPGAFDQFLHQSSPRVCVGTRTIIWLEVM